jgi:ADP-ribosylglycohydrolase
VTLCRALVRGLAWDAARSLAARPRDACGRGCFAPEALAAAVHFVGAADGFAVALEPSLRFAGPANYCPVLVGALAGARWRAAAVNPGALAHCEIQPRVREAAEG